CRSQMAEGWGRALQADKFEVFSAGIEAHGLNPNAVRVMDEAGIDITGQKSQTVADLENDNPSQPAFDLVITVCGHADEHCPVLAGTPRIVHVGFDDPPSFARNAATEDEALAPYRRVRDEIRAFVAGMHKTVL
ncbi:MAG: arsenate reductase ArsC, partial [Pirellulaceae bacterium]|nr:arsenate reductase ArsC [Pirellulaceae bacterium]